MEVCQLLQLIPDLFFSFSPCLFHKSWAYMQVSGAHTQKDIHCLLLSCNETNA